VSAEEAAEAADLGIDVDVEATERGRRDGILDSDQVVNSEGVAVSLSETRAARDRADARAAEAISIANSVSNVSTRTVADVIGYGFVSDLSTVENNIAITDTVNNSFTTGVTTDQRMGTDPFSAAPTIDPVDAINEMAALSDFGPGSAASNAVRGVDVVSCGSGCVMDTETGIEFDIDPNFGIQPNIDISTLSTAPAPGPANQFSGVSTPLSDITTYNATPLNALTPAQATKLGYNQALFTQRDIETMAQMCAGECDPDIVSRIAQGTVTEEDIAAIGLTYDVMMNRTFANAGYIAHGPYDNITEAIRAPGRTREFGQVSAFNPANIDTTMANYELNPQAFNDLAAAYVDGSLARSYGLSTVSPTPGAVGYHNPDLATQANIDPTTVSPNLGGHIAYGFTTGDYSFTGIAPGVEPQIAGIVSGPVGRTDTSLAAMSAFNEPVAVATAGLSFSPTLAETAATAYAPASNPTTAALDAAYESLVTTSPQAEKEAQLEATFGFDLTPDVISNIESIARDQNLTRTEAIAGIATEIGKVGASVAAGVVTSGLSTVGQAVIGGLLSDQPSLGLGSLTAGAAPPSSPAETVSLSRAPTPGSRPDPNAVGNTVDTTDDARAMRSNLGNQTAAQLDAAYQTAFEIENAARSAQATTDALSTDVTNALGRAGGPDAATVAKADIAAATLNDIRSAQASADLALDVLEQAIQTNNPVQAAVSAADVQAMNNQAAWSEDVRDFAIDQINTRGAAGIPSGSFTVETGLPTGPGLGQLVSGAFNIGPLGPSRPDTINAATRQTFELAVIAMQQKYPGFSVRGFSAKHTDPNFDPAKLSKADREAYRAGRISKEALMAQGKGRPSGRHAFGYGLDVEITIAGRPVTDTAVLADFVQTLSAMSPHAPGNVGVGYSQAKSPNEITHIDFDPNSPNNSWSYDKSTVPGAITSAIGKGRTEGFPAGITDPRNNQTVSFAQTDLTAGLPTPAGRPDQGQVSTDIDPPAYADRASSMAVEAARAAVDISPLSSARAQAEANAVEALGLAERAQSATEDEAAEIVGRVEELSRENDTLTEQAVAEMESFRTDNVEQVGFVEGVAEVAANALETAGNAVADAIQSVTGWDIRSGSGTGGQSDRLETGESDDRAQDNDSAEGEAAGDTDRGARWWQQAAPAVTPTNERREWVDVPNDYFYIDTTPTPAGNYREIRVIEDETTGEVELEVVSEITPEAVDIVTEDEDYFTTGQLPDVVVETVVSDSDDGRVASVLVEINQSNADGRDGKLPEEYIPVTVTINEAGRTVTLRRTDLETTLEELNEAGFDVTTTAGFQLLASEATNPPLILNERGEVIYSNGLYAPPTIAGEPVQAKEDIPAYVYLVEYLNENGEIVAASESTAGADGLIGSVVKRIFNNDDPFTIDDVREVTFELTDPNRSVARDEYYIYTIKLTDNTIRTAHIPEFASVVTMRERFGDVGFEGDVLLLRAEGIEVVQPEAVDEGVLRRALSAMGSALNNFVGLFTDDTALAPTNGLPIREGGSTWTIDNVDALFVYPNAAVTCPDAPGLADGYAYKLLLTDYNNPNERVVVTDARCGVGDPLTIVAEIGHHLETDYGITPLPLDMLVDQAVFNDFPIEYEVGVVASRVVKVPEEGSSGADTVPEPNLEEIIPADAIPNTTNTIQFEVKVTDPDGNTLVDWTTNGVMVDEGAELAFRWDGSDYGQCIPFLADGGRYSLTRPGEVVFISGNTEVESFDIFERTGQYRVQCDEQLNGEFGTDAKIITVGLASDEQDSDAVDLDQYGLPDNYYYDLFDGRWRRSFTEEDWTNPDGTINPLLYELRPIDPSLQERGECIGAHNNFYLAIALSELAGDREVDQETRDAAFESLKKVLKRYNEFEAKGCFDVPVGSNDAAPELMPGVVLTSAQSNSSDDFEYGLSDDYFVHPLTGEILSHNEHVDPRLLEVGECIGAHDSFFIAMGAMGIAVDESFDQQTRDQAFELFKVFVRKYNEYEAKGCIDYNWD
jgi:hypothetical protein